MPQNMEIKARVADMARLRKAVESCADQGPFDIPQDDTFFRCDNGRLKLRAFPDGTGAVATRGELIYYRRADAAGPQSSFYVRTPTADPDGLREALTLAHGQIGRVRKHRILFLVGRTRVHLDRVEGLGEFMELEVVMAEGEAPQAGMDEARALMERLGIKPAEWVQGAYLDLLKAR